MITLMFLKSWFTWLTGTVVTVFVEFALLRGHPWILAGVALGTVLVFTGVTTALLSDWKMQRRVGSSYRYNLVNDVTSDKW